MNSIKKIIRKFFKNIEGKDRFYAIKIILFITMFLLFIRLAYLTIIKGNYYRDISENSRIREVEIVAPRGNIYDRNGDVLAGNKTVYTASIMKDEFTLLASEEKNENLLKLSRYLDLDGATYNMEYPISYNIISYKNKDDYISEDESPIEKTVRIIIENNLVPTLIKEEYKENTKNGEYKYRVVDSIIKSIKNKGYNLPLSSGMDKLEFEDVENNDFLKDKGYEENQSPYEFLANYAKEDEGIIRNILNHPVGRKIVYDLLKDRKLEENLVIKKLGFQDEESLLEIKATLSKNHSGITLDSDAKDDFVEIVKDSSLPQLLDNVTLNASSEDDNVVVPAKIALEILRKKNIDNDIVVDIDESNKNNPVASIKYKSKDKNKDINAKDLLIKLLIENDLLEDFITSDKIKFIAQKINTELNITPQISVVDWVYTYEKNISDLYEKYKVDEEDGVKNLYKAIKEKYEVDKYSDYDTYNIIKIYDALEKHGDLRYVPLDLTYNISEVTFSKIKENFTDDSGIFVDSESIRYYPHGELASHVIGYMGKISTESEINTYLKEEKYNADSLIGKTGVEEGQELQLKGENGFKRVMVDNRGNTTEVLGETKPTPGKDVYTSIDRKIQQAAEGALKETISSLTGDNVFNSDWGDVNLVNSSNGQYKDATSGAVVVLDAKTGQLVAMANEPGVNLNMFSTGISSSDWKNLFPKDERDMFAPRPLLNIAMQSAIQPGSTFKLATSLAGLSSGLNPDHPINCSGHIKVGGRVFQDAVWGSHGGMHGNETLKDAIKDSCNIYFYKLALGEEGESKDGSKFKLEVDSIEKYAKMLGLGEKTGIDINIPAESSGILPDRKIKKASYRNQFIKFLEENAKSCLVDKKTSDEDLQDLIKEITSWIDEEVVPSESEVIKRLKELGFDPNVKIGSDDRSFSTKIKYDYLDQSEWLIGDSLNVVIGQGQNAYTPLQMARYMSTIANGGYKNKVSVVDKVVNSKDGVAVYENTPTSERIDIDDYSYIDIIREGTNMASKDALNSNVLGKLPFEMGIKSGTAETGLKNPVTGKEYSDHGWMIGFAPYEDPQYVVAAVVIQAGTSQNITPLMREVLGAAMEVYPSNGNSYSNNNYNNNDDNNDNNDNNETIDDE
ncbi:MAG: penicillin-binding transpeptidase domain-containing protein [Miniphocaeibacter sp.]|uniref:penicillin-binding transpeptidase domain-containing protein n=1 Tax=Miniphocaeibacter sp. TaxID=3100973 RepID=UPI0017FDF38D|nr:penicillin-binding protein [Gallicola sp.]